MCNQLLYFVTIRNDSASDFLLPFFCVCICNKNKRKKRQIRWFKRKSIYF